VLSGCSPSPVESPRNRRERGGGKEEKRRKKKERSAKWIKVVLFFRILVGRIVYGGHGLQPCARAQGKRGDGAEEKRKGRKKRKLASLSFRPGTPCLPKAATGCRRKKKGKKKKKVLFDVCSQSGIRYVIS